MLYDPMQYTYILAIAWITTTDIISSVYDVAFILQAIWKRLYKKTSGTDKGTLFYFKVLLNRSAVPKEPLSNVAATEDFLLLILTSHVIIAAQVVSELNPNASVQVIAKSIIDSFLNLQPSLEKATKLDDGVQAYAKELLTLGLLWHGFHDACKEGDGDRIVRYWRMMMLVFKKQNKYNYAKESLILLHQAVTLTARERGQLLWSRTVNTHGRIGCNIPMDLHMEHLNRRLKQILRGLGSNITQNAISRASRSIHVVERICELFDMQQGLSQDSQKHRRPSFKRDLDRVLQELHPLNIFHNVAHRKHNAFTFKKCLLQSLDLKEIRSWITDTL